MNYANVRFVRRLQRGYKQHFSALSFLGLACLLGLSLYLASHAAPFAAITASLLVCAAMGYYLLFFRVFRRLADDFSPVRHYYLEAYSGWGVMSFSCLFLLVFAHVGNVLGLLFPGLGFNGASFYQILIVLAETVVDSVSLGLLSAYSWTFSTLVVTGAFARSYVYFVNVLIDMVILASVVSVVAELRSARREVGRIARDNQFDPVYFACLSPVKVREILRSIRSGKIDLALQGDKIVAALCRSGSKESRDLMLQIFQSSHCAQTQGAVVRYFQQHPDYRFQRVCRRMGIPPAAVKG